MAELDAGRIAAMFATDAQLDIRTGLSTGSCRHFDQLADTLLIQVSEWIALKDLLLIVIRQETARIITGETKGHLREVIGTEGEELRLLRDLIGQQCRSWDLDHRTDLIGHRPITVCDDPIGGLRNDLLDKAQLCLIADQRDHDLRFDRPLRMALLHIDRRFDDRSGLHLCDLRI